MEHSSHKSYVAYMTTPGADVIHHKERYWDKGKQNTYLFKDFISSTFTILAITGSPAGTPAWCLTLQVAMIKPVDFCYVTCVCISSEPHAIYPHASSCP